MDAISIPEAGRQPKCIYCGAIRESFTGDPCPCPGAIEARADRVTALERERVEATAESQRRADREAKAKASMPTVSALRYVSKRDQQDAELADRERAVKDRELARRERRQDGYDAADTPAETVAGETLADFTHTFTEEVDLTPLPALLERNDGVTILYSGKLNWVSGLPGSGKIVACHSRH